MRGDARGSSQCHNGESSAIQGRRQNWKLRLVTKHSIVVVMSAYKEKLPSECCIYHNEEAPKMCIAFEDGSLRK